MNLLRTLFGKKRFNQVSFEEKELQREKWEGFDLFQKGKQCYLDRQTKEALMQFDMALKNGFANYFSNEAPNFYFMRASCLQELGYDFEAINDFDKSIELSPKDCNNFFSRSVSKE